MAIPFAGWEPGRHPGGENLLALVGDEHQLTLKDIDKLVFVGMPMTLRGPGTRGEPRQIDPELS